MKPTISAGDRVLVKLTKYGQQQAPFRATVVAWTDGGKLKVKPDGDKRRDTKTVSADNVKKLADGPQTV